MLKCGRQRKGTHCFVNSVRFLCSRIWEKLTASSDPSLIWVAIIVQWLVVERAENKLFLLVAVADTYPHPLPDPRCFIREFHFHVVTAFVGGRSRSRILR